MLARLTVLSRVFWQIKWQWLFWAYCRHFVFWNAHLLWTKKLQWETCPPTTLKKVLWGLYNCIQICGFWVSQSDIYSQSPNKLQSFATVHYTWSTSSYYFLGMQAGAWGDRGVTEYTAAAATDQLWTPLEYLSIWVLTACKWKIPILPKPIS